MPKKPVEEQNLSVPFFVLSVIFLVTLLYMVYDEAFLRRPWKRYQKEFYNIQVEKLGDDLEQAEADLAEQVKDATDYRTAKSDLENLLARGSGHAKDLKEAEAEYTDREIDLARVSEQYNFKKADYEAMRYLVEKANAEGDPHYSDLAERLDEIRIERDEAEAKALEEQNRFDAAESELFEIRNREKELRDVVDGYEKEVQSLGARRDQIEERYLSLLTTAGFEERFVPKPEAIKQIIDNELGVVDRCTTCHMGIDKAGFEDRAQPFSTHPHLEELLVRNHSKIGCTPCHFGRGRALTEWHGHGYEKHWLWPLKEGDLVQSTCYSCHDRQDELEYAPLLNQGHELIEEAACFGCHAMKGYEWKRVGPTLDKIASKADFSWLVGWIEQPKEYLPKTRMPYFYLSSEQSEAVAAYLVHSSSETDETPVDISAGDPEAGEDLVSETGCLGCHSLDPKDNDTGPKHGPNLSEVGKKTNPAWIYRWLKDPVAYYPETKMPNLRLTDREALDITAYLAGLTGEAPPKHYDLPQGDQLASLAQEGEEIIKRYGCFGCHYINGFEDRGRIGTELSEWGGKETHFLDFGHQEIPHTREAWLTHKLKDPRSFDLGRVLPEKDKLRMPNFELDDGEIHALVVAITSLVKEPVPDVRRIMPESRKYQPTQTEKDIIAGRKVIRKFNCTGCHEVERRGEDEFWGGDIQDSIEDPGYYPPIVYGEGKKVQSEWLYNFLKNVKSIRPWMTVRMPDFPFTDEEVLALVKYFNAIEEAEWPYLYMEDKEFPERNILAGMHLLRGYQCVKCHPANQEMVDGTPDKSTLAPNLSLVKERLRFDWLYDWIINPNELAPGTRMPDNFPEMGDQEDASFAHQMMNTPQNAELKTWFDENYTGQEQEEFLSDTEWVIARMQDQLWNFDAEAYLAKFPWIPPPPPAEEADDGEWEDDEYYEDDEEYEDEDYEYDEEDEEYENETGEGDSEDGGE